MPIPSVPSISQILLLFFNFILFALFLASYMCVLCLTENGVLTATIDCNRFFNFGCLMSYVNAFYNSFLLKIVIKFSTHILKS